MESEQAKAPKGRPKRGFWSVIQWIFLWGTIFGLTGVALVAVTNKAVIWSSSDSFCGTLCHTMTWSSAAYHQGPHFINASGVRASCGQCHIPYDSSHATATEYVKLLLFKADRARRISGMSHARPLRLRKSGKSNDHDCEQNSKTTPRRTITLPVAVVIRSKRLADRGAA